mgnify:CR=1 FL=1
MTNPIRKAINTLRYEGLAPLIKKGVPFIYDNYILKLLPRSIIRYNGVDVRAGWLFDTTLPWREGHRPKYESAIMSSISQHVSKRDDVVIVGGGWGVTAVGAAKQTGSSGSVTVYEGARREVERVKDTISLNGVSNTVHVEHAIVGSDVHLKSESGDARQIRPDELPECDVLELDCEGAEIMILEDLDFYPKYLIVESHGLYDAPTSEVQKTIESMPYSILSTEIAVDDYSEDCIKYDIYVVTARRVQSN